MSTYLKRILYFLEYAMNSSSWEREVHEGLLVAGTGHSEIVKPVDASICFDFTVG